MKLMNFPCIISVIIVLGYGFTEATYSTCSRSCHCRHKSKMARCGKYMPGLTTIPKVPTYVRHFIFSNGNLPVVNRSVLSALSNNSLLSLSLIHDRIVIISEEAFTDFQNLILLDLRENKIPVNVLSSAFKSLGYQLTKLVLSDMDISCIPQDLIATNKTQNITKLKFSHNKLTFFNDSMFASMPNLFTLDLSYNRISSLPRHNLKGHPNIRDMYLSNNWLKVLPTFCWPNGTARYGKLRSLNVESNGITSLNTLSTSCLDNVNKLVLSGNLMSVLANNTFSSFHQLNTLHLSNLPRLKIIEELAFNSTSIEILHFTDNPRIKPNMFPGNFPFKWTSKLADLSLQGSRIVLSLNSFKALLLQLKTIKKLNLQRTQINTIPTRTLCHLPLLKTLDVQGNYLAKWDEETFRNVTQIRYLNMDGNRITIIDEKSFPTEFRNNIKKINLGNNDFLCTCALLWFRTWMNKVMKEKTLYFINYPSRYYCKDPTHLRLDKFNPTEESCKTLSPYIIPLVSTGCSIIVVLFIVVLIYYNRWNIRYFMYTWRRREYRQLPGLEIRKKFDVFVSFDSNDSEWMTTEVGDFLENELKLKLCNHEKHFEGGKMIFDNIVDCMSESEKIILIVSNNFARSNWCKCELKLAVNQKFEAHKDVVVVIRETVHRHFMFKSLKALLDTTTYIQWEDDEQARRVFRRRLAEVMRCEHLEI